MPIRERRKYRRVKGTLRVSFTLDVSVTIPFSCYTKDFGEGGMRLIVSRKIIPGNTIVLNFNLPGSEFKIRIFAEVVWAAHSKSEKNKFEAGIRFLSLTADQRKSIREYIRKRKSKAA